MSGPLGRTLSQLGVRLGRALVRRDPTGSADAVVVLGGAPRYRTPAAVGLWRAGAAPVVVAVGGSHGAQEARRTAAALAAAGLPAAAVLVVEEDAPGTWDEARAIARLARARGWSRILLVTSPYHTRRAAHFFEQALGPGVTVLAVPAADDPWTPEAWWRTGLHVRLSVAEVLKYLSWRSGARAVWMRLR